MKNKLLYTILALLLTVNAGYCVPASVHGAVVKFSYAMAGVVISSLIIYVGLTVYNKFFAGFRVHITPEEEILKTPKTKTEAINFYIRKNRL